MNESNGIRVLRCLAQPDRLRIIQCLRGGPKNVGELANELGIAMVNISHHLRVLRLNAVVLDERRGQFIYYRLHSDVCRSAKKGEKHDALDLACCRVLMPVQAPLVSMA